MKKVYTAPLISIEHYELTQTIASCSIKIGATSTTCVLEDNDSTDYMYSLAIGGGFLDGAAGCKKPILNEDHGDSICYHTSTTSAFVS